MKTSVWYFPGPIYVTSLLIPFIYFSYHSLFFSLLYFFHISLYSTCFFLPQFSSFHTFLSFIILFIPHVSFFHSSLKTVDNLEVVKSIPEDRLLLETDCPWCEVKPSHAGFKYVQTSFEKMKKEAWKSDKMVKNRNEPANIV